MTFIPSGAAQTPTTVTNDGFFPDLDTAELKAWTGLDDTFATARLAAELRAAIVEINATLAVWRAGLTAPRLADLPAPLVDGQSAGVIAYKTGVYARARAAMVETTRDFDSTKSGHARADALEPTADIWLRRSTEALSRLTGRPRAI
ncbi:MAG: head completion/stabilization protein, partial [Alphaproteobacteria bacterium]|nr:head completion/stabilization protein [Alphaproteobacteria bacterium]